MQLAELRHHGNLGAAAQRLLSDVTQGYLSKYTLELPPEDHVKRWIYTGTDPECQESMPRSPASVQNEEASKETENHSLFGTLNSDVSTWAKIAPNGKDHVSRNKATRWMMQRRGETIVFTLESLHGTKTHQTVETTNLPVHSECETPLVNHTCSSLPTANNAVAAHRESAFGMNTGATTADTCAREIHGNPKQMASKVVTDHGHFDGW